MNRCAWLRWTGQSLRWTVSYWPRSRWQCGRLRDRRWHQCLRPPFRSRQRGKPEIGCSTSPPAHHRYRGTQWSNAPHQDVGGDGEESAGTARRKQWGAV